MSTPVRLDENTSQSSIPTVYSRNSESETRFSFPWQNKREDSHERAYLMRLIEVPGNLEAREDSKPFTIIARDIIIGSNPLKASMVIEDSSVEGMHAHLSNLDDGSFLIADLGSTAGTWLNYAPISQDGARLEHGDLLHIGRIGFRFVRTASITPPKRTIISKQGNHN
jgi:pSer/pThr/pTyr-binding forkhead associated (FHA) protein